MVTLRSLRVAYPKAWISEASEVDEYLLALKDILLAEIRSGKKIQP